MGQQSAPAARGRGQRGRPPVIGRAYAMTSQEARATPDVVIGTLSIFGTMHVCSLTQELHTPLFHVSMLHESG